MSKSTEVNSAETAGPSRGYYSNSSSHSSSAESIQNMSSISGSGSGSGSGGSDGCGGGGTGRSRSTLDSTNEPGNLSVFTFLMSKYISPDLSHLPDQVQSCVHKTGCHCSNKPFRRLRVGGVNSNSVSFGGMDPYGLKSHHRVNVGVVGSQNCSCDCTLGKLCRNSGFGGDSSSSYSSLLSHSNLDGYLIRSLEKGVLYPVIHWSPKAGHGDADLDHTQADFGSSVNSSAVFNQGVYRELKRVIPPDAWIHKSDPSSDSTGSTLPKRPTWLVLGYKSLEKTLDPTLEATWKEWTGTRHIYLNLRHDFDIQRISFYNRVAPADNLDLFMYLVCMEIGNVDDGNVMWLLDFVQRTRVERMKGFLTVYTEIEVENEFSTLSDEYLKYFSCSGTSTNNSKSKSEESLNLGLPTPVGGGCDLSGKNFIEKLLQELQDTPLVDYF